MMNIRSRFSFPWTDAFCLIWDNPKHRSPSFLWGNPKHQPPPLDRRRDDGIDLVVSGVVVDD